MKYDFHHKQFADTETNVSKTAVSGSDGDLSWAELKTTAEKIAETLRSLAVPAGAPVLIYGHKESFYAAAILGCIHSSTAYIPADKIYPADRLRKIMSIAAVQIVINCTGEKLPFETAIEIDRNLHVEHFSKAEFEVYADVPENDLLQYIMFTSGSTGEPKGVQITRNATLAFMDWALSDFGLGGDDVFMNQAPFTFDVSLCDLFHAFALGGTLVLNDTELIKNPDAFLARLGDYHCSVWTSTPSFVYLFLRHPMFSAAKMDRLHTFIFMGEELPARSCQQIRKAFPSARILNAYGPTEATIVTTLADITDEIIAQYPSLPIGFPMRGSELLIEPAEAGQREGELIICGDHVSTGYFRKPDLNEKKFFMKDGKRCFRTGDLAYYENGMLFFLGRNDDQVKLHGYRIELNEISNVICRSEGVDDAVTVPLKRGQEVRKLIVFLKLKPGFAAEQVKEKIKNDITGALPYYMHPGDMMVVDDFPYGSSHKIDRQKLVDLYLASQQ